MVMKRGKICNCQKTIDKSDHVLVAQLVGVLITAMVLTVLVCVAEDAGVNPGSVVIVVSTKGAMTMTSAVDDMATRVGHA